MSGWAATVFVILVALLIIQAWHYVERTSAMRRRYEQRIREINHEYRTQTQMLRRLRLPDVINTDDSDR